MAANTWLAKLNVLPDALPDALCRCSHTAKEHLHGKSCGHGDATTFQICKCEVFREAKNQNEIGDEMSKKAGSTMAKKPKGEGRKPALAPFVDSPFKIYMTTGGKEYDGQVLSSGIIKIDEKEFTSPSSAGSYILGNDKKGKPRQVDGWKSWTFNKDGERVVLDTLRGSKSPLKAADAKPKREKKATKPNGSGTAKSAAAPKPRKPRAARKSKPVAEQAQIVTQETQAVRSEDAAA